jgi:tRNA(Arg) A34 adenosine deaminase TadA
VLLNPLLLYPSVLAFNTEFMTVDETYMRRAVEMSWQSMNMGGGPFGAVIVLNGNLIGEGCNQVITQNDPTAHAEVMAMREACRALGQVSLAGAVLYSSCEPCPMCLAASYWARISRIVYGATQHDAARGGFDDAAFYQQMQLPEDKRNVPMTSVYRAEAALIFHKWMKKEDRVEY